MNVSRAGKYKIKVTHQLDHVGMERLPWQFLEIVALEQRHKDDKGQLRRKGGGGYSTKGNLKEQSPRGN